MRWDFIPGFGPVFESEPPPMTPAEARAQREYGNHIHEVMLRLLNERGESHVWLTPESCAQLMDDAIAEVDGWTAQN